MRDWLWLPVHYVGWHYSSGWRDYFAVAGNGLWFIWHFFSFPLNLRHLFSPWKRLGERYSSAIDPEAWLETFIVNLLMRAVGLTLRLMLILFGLITLALVALGVILLAAVWLIAPLVPWALALTGFYLLTA